MDSKKPNKVGELRPHKGHTVFQFNTVTGKLSLAVVGVDENNKKSIKVEKDCIYVSALNRKNALKKLNQYFI